MHFITASLAMNSEDEVEVIRQATPGAQSGTLKIGNTAPQDDEQIMPLHTAKSCPSPKQHESRHCPASKPVRGMNAMNENPSLANGTGSTILHDKWHGL